MSKRPFTPPPLPRFRKETKFMTKLQDQNVHSEYENKCAKLRKKQKLSTFLQKYTLGKIPFGKTHLGEKNT